MSISGDKQPPWWDPGLRLTNLSETTLELARQLEARLFPLSEPSQALPALDVENPELAWAAAVALRAAIADAAASGAPHECVGAMHQRLDEELRALGGVAMTRLIEERRALLEGVSHDIRSPLNSILFLADALLAEHSGELNPNQKRQIGVVYGAAVALVRLVNDLIDFARLDEGAGAARTKVPFRVDAVLEDVRRLVGPLLDHQGVGLVVRNEAPEPRCGDPQLVSRLMINLLANAIDAAPEGGEVEALFQDEGGTRFRLEFTNDGAPDDLEELRSRLESESGRRRMKGPGWTHGLGLTISSRLVRAARGTMTVDSPGGERTRFAIELPYPVAGSGS